MSDFDRHHNHQHVLMWRGPPMHGECSCEACGEYVLSCQMAMHLRRESDADGYPKSCWGAEWKRREALSRVEEPQHRAGEQP